MASKRLALPDVVLFSPKVYPDDRGRFLETHRTKDILGENGNFVQGNVSYSRPWVLRGLHYQTVAPQGKLVRCLSGKIYDVAVDMREGSPTLGHWVGAFLDDIACASLWVPPGFAHGFLALSSPVTVHYECTSYYDEEVSQSIRWDDPGIGITWPTQGHQPLLSSKDIKAGRFADAPRVTL